MALVPRSFEQDFLSPFFSGDNMWPLASPLFNQPLLGGSELTTRQMPLDLKETDTSFELKADIPGVSKDNIKVTVDNDVLRINVEKEDEKKEEKEEGGAKWHRYERSSQFVGRALRMPENADLDKVKASYKNGVLVLDISKKKAGKEEGAKRITVG